MNKKTIADMIHDTGISACGALICSAGMGLLLFIIFGLVSGQVLKGLSAARSGLLMAGAFAMLISAGMLLTGKGKDIRNYAGWRKWYKQYGLLGAMLSFSAAMLLIAGIYDAILFYTLK